MLTKLLVVVTTVLIVNSLGASRALAAVFGKDDLSSPGHTQCDFDDPNRDDDLGMDAPPSGAIYLRLPEGDYLVGSGDVVSPGLTRKGGYFRDLVVTAGHSISTDGAHHVAEGVGTFVFKLWERNAKGECTREEYAAAEIITGQDYVDAPLWSRDSEGFCRPQYEFTFNKSIEKSGTCTNPEYDFAVVRLEREVEAYYPLEVAPPELVNSAVNAGPIIGLTAFPLVEGTNFGELLSVTTCSIYPTWGTKFHRGIASAFAHDCDAVPGSSGGAMTIVRKNPAYSVGAAESPQAARRFLRYLIGITIQGATHGDGGQTFDDFIPGKQQNTGIFVTAALRDLLSGMAKRSLSR